MVSLPERWRRCARLAVKGRVMRLRGRRCSLAKGSPESIPALLESMDGANPFASNYLRGAVEVIAGNTLAKGGSLPLVELGEFLLNKSHDTKPRAMAFDLIRRADAEAAERLVPGLLSDPSVDLRRRR